MLNWPGKAEAFRILQQPTTATLAPAVKESVDFNNTENIFIEGENLEVLKVRPVPQRLVDMMYPRLFLARNLLRDDGVIFISIDDNEVHNLRMVMNEIFGEENFIACISWQKKYGPEMMPNTYLKPMNTSYYFMERMQRIGDLLYLIEVKNNWRRLKTQTMIQEEFGERVTYQLERIVRVVITRLRFQVESGLNPSDWTPELEQISLLL
jgi:hypothetical protein